ncbi:hypothetical protein HDU97_008747 [Phlyctochytrium planicorne]|nr:hypothetical protein HDU97_008747 [Phlyctochytrium planicorne]
MSSPPKLASVPPKEPDAEKQLKTGMALIHDAFEKRTAFLTGELNHWKQTANNLRQEVYSIESENKLLNQKVAELERLCANQANEIQSLTLSKSTLQDKYQQLKRSAMQLESFRKNIITMVEFGPSVNVNVLESDQSFAEIAQISEGGRRQRHQNTDILSSPDKEFLSEPRLKSEFSKSVSHVNDTSSRSFDMSAQALDHSLGLNEKSFLLKGSVFSPERKSQTLAHTVRNIPISTKAGQDTRVIDEAVSSSWNDADIGNRVDEGSARAVTQQHMQNSNEVPPNTVVDAPTLYKQIRDNLSLQEFEEFAANVAAFNASEQSADETVSNIGKLVKDRMLFAQMRTLIYTALAESAKGTSQGVSNK